MQFQYSQLLLLVAPVLALLAFIVRKNFSRVSRIQQRSTFRQVVRQRSFVLVSRAVIFVLLIVAMASPFTLKTFVKVGDPTLTVLIDNSSSMEVFDASGVDGLVQQIGKSIPVRERTFSSGSVSAVGDAIISAINGNDNILLVSDGRSNKGRSLGDMLVLASSLNSTISAIDLAPSKGDSAVAVLGPRITTNAEENDFDVVVNQVGGRKGYRLVVSIDDEALLDSEYSGSNTLTVSKKFSDGYHRIKAEIVLDDFFPQNNVFYKSVKVEPKPGILFVRRESAPVSNILNSLYRTTTATSLSGQSLEGYSAVVLDDIPESEVDVEKLSSYVIDGNGLVVFGGRNSFDRGGYKDSVFESMLPVRVGKGREGKRTDVNVALVIDISGSTGSGFSKGSSSKVEEVEKALAVGVINDLKKSDKVAVIAFNTDAYVVSELMPLIGSEDYIKKRIEKLVYKGGTRIDEGVKAAREMLAPLEGSKSIIIFSDGKSGSYSQDLYDAQIAAGNGIKIYTIGVGEGTNRKHMQDIAKAGNGYYFEPEETERLRVVFGDSEETPGAASYSVEIVNSHHFITQGLKVSARVNGFNQVVQKPNAELLLATESNNPLLSVSRLGLGRIAAFSTDDGSAWASELLNAQNSVAVTKAINWAVGDLSRNKDFDVDVRDVYLGDEMDVNVVSGSLPSYGDLRFAKAGKRLYTAAFVPEETGFQEFFDAVAAVNYGSEYLSLGMNPQLEDQLEMTGGRLFAIGDADAIVDKVKEDSRRVVSEPMSYSWLFLLAAMLVFLAEVCIRKTLEGKANK